MTIRMFEVGGCVRDELLGLKPKDIDYAIEITHAPAYSVEEAFGVMTHWLESQGFKIFLRSPEYGTIRARLPESVGKSGGYDFVLCRKDGPSSDGRRPDYIEVGTLRDDLMRRDFTVNALAREIFPDENFRRDTVVHDLQSGLHDLSEKRLRFVGDPMERLREDGLRALRAIRFHITKGFEFAPETFKALLNRETATLLAGCSEERKREELERCFAHDSRATCDVLFHMLPLELVDAIFTGDLRLMPTMKKGGK